MTWWRVSMEIPAALAESVAWLLTEETGTPAEVQDTTTLARGANPGMARVVVGFEDEPSEDFSATVADILGRFNLTDTVIETSSSDDDSWKTGWRAFFQGTAVSKRFRVRLPDEAPVDDGRMTVVIEPGMAFGTGTHPTTRLVLAMLDDRLAEGSTPSHILDVGAGSAILSIAAALLGIPAVGVEVDGAAFNNARENLALNGVEALVRLVEASIDDFLEPAPLVLANMLAGRLIQHAEGVKACSPEELILAGLIEEQEDAVLAAYPEFKVVERRSEGDWVALRVVRR